VTGAPAFIGANGATSDKGIHGIACTPASFSIP
jgi:hypothetical protein